jgi:2-polyprenyl-3-methyl-5-hydroxy-6-metoxy-1,4-benzoquinol methylase
MSASQAGVLGHYRKAPLSARVFLSLRWRLTPYERMASELPESGKILDMGCGHGLLSLAAALASPAREVIGTDHDEARISVAAEAARGLRNLRYERRSLLETAELAPASAYAGVTLIDVMHYFPPEAQEKILDGAARLLAPGGVVLLREVDPSPSLASSWNRCYERLATSVGFTRADGQKHHFRRVEEWKDALERRGLRATSFRCGSSLFSDVLFRGVKEAAR